MDPMLAQGFSSLTKALIGDPETDYQVARTGYQNAQTGRLNELLPHEKANLIAQEAQRRAAAGASTAQGGYYNSQTAGQNIQNEGDANLLSSLNTLSLDPAFQGSAAAVLGLPKGTALTPEALQALAYQAISGGNPQQRATALDTIGAGGQDRAAGNAILNGTDNEAQRGALLLAPTGGQYQNPGFAASALKLNNETDVKQTRITADASVNAARIGADALQAYQRYTTDARYGVGGSADREGARKTIQAKWEHNNATLEINVEPGKQVILSPEAGKRLDLEPNNEGLYVLDGGPKPGSIVVKVGEEDVYLTEADATALGITKSDTGTYMIPGRAKPSNPDGTSKSNYSVPPSVDSAFVEQLNVLMDGKKLPLPLQLQIKAVAGADYSSGGDASKSMKKLQEAFGQLITVDAPGLGNKTYTTTTTLEETREVAENKSRDAAKQMLIDLEYSEDQANEIMKLAGV
jgi:hypothetical protein